MNQSPRYLIAQFVGDAMRMEPKNIGVIAWTPNAVASRFFAERNGLIIQSQVPDFIREPSIYVQWVEHWRSLASQEKIEPLGGGEAIGRGDERFLAALASYSKKSYFLRDGGVILDVVEDVDDLAEYLFDTLVEYRGTRRKGVRNFCSEAVKSTRLPSLRAFKKDYPITANVLGKQDRFTLDYSVVNGLPKFAIQSVSMPEISKGSEHQVNSAKWIFEHLQSVYNLAKADLTTVVLFPESAEVRREAEESLGLLHEMSTVVDVKNGAELLSKFKRAEELAVALEEH